MSERIILDYGRLKGWELVGNETAQTLLQQYAEPGRPFDPKLIERTPERIQTLCDLIDAVNGPVVRDEDGAELSKADAKAYVTDWSDA